MKDLTKSVILILGLLVTAIGCQEPNLSEQDPTPENIEISYRTVSLDEIPEVKNIIENIRPQIEEAGGLFRQTSTVYGVAKVDTEEIIALTKQGLTNYTFAIDTDFKNSGFIENLQLIKVDEGYIAYIMRYEPEEGWENDDFNKTPKGELVLDVKNFNGHKTKYTLGGQIIWTTNPTYNLPHYRIICRWVTTKYCYNDGGGGYSSEPHVASPRCNGYQGEFIYSDEWVCEEVNYEIADDATGSGGSFQNGNDNNNESGFDDHNDNGGSQNGHDESGTAGGSYDGNNDPNNPPEEDDCIEVIGSLIANNTVVADLSNSISRACTDNSNTSATISKFDNLKFKIEDCLGEDYNFEGFDDILLIHEFLINYNNCSQSSIEIINTINQTMSSHPNLDLDDIIEENMVNINYFETPNIEDIEAELECFDRNQPAELIIYAEQSISGSRELTANIGHSFVSIVQNGVARSLGFYPDSPTASVLSNQDSEIHDNSNSPYDVSVTIDITSEQLSDIIDYIEDYPSTYDLNNYNCSDFVIDIAGEGGLTIPSTVGSYGILFEGRNPSDLGEDLRELNLPEGASRNLVGGNALSRLGNCN